MSNEISFAGLNGLDTTRFMVATSNEFPNGRYSGTINNVTPETKDSKGNFTLRFKMCLQLRI